MPETFDPHVFKDDDYVEIRAGETSLSGGYPPGPSRRAVTVAAGKTDVVPWALARRWRARKLCDVLSETGKPEAAPRRHVDGPLAFVGDLALERAAVTTEEAARRRYQAAIEKAAAAGEPPPADPRKKRKPSKVKKDEAAAGA